MTNMVENMWKEILEAPLASLLISDHLGAETSNTSICKVLMKYLDSSSVERIPLLTSSMMTMISSVEVLEAWA
jgi:hypothetical protein